jgi:hypothetical protein
MSKRALKLTLVTLAITSGRADAKPSARFFLDGAFGLAVPIADTTYRDRNYPAPTLGLHLGAEVWVTPRIGLAPELALDGGPIIGRASVNTGRVRAQPGLRVLFGFGRGHAFFLRTLIGADLIIAGPGAVAGLGKVDAGLSVEGGAGMQFRIARRAVAGFSVGVPVSIHTFNTPGYGTQTDLQAVAFIGYRR